MRLSDGLIRECDFGVAIVVERENLAVWEIVAWTYLFIFNGNQKAINKMVINMIDFCQQSLSLAETKGG